MSIEEAQRLVLLLLVKFYVYVYLDPRKPGRYVYGDYSFDYEPFYVGKGCDRRWLNHLNECKSNSYFNNKIKKIQKEIGDDPIVIKYKENMFRDDAYSLETLMITKIGRVNTGKGPLCNLMDGGTGGPVMRGDDNPSKRSEVRLKISEGLKSVVHDTKYPKEIIEKSKNFRKDGLSFNEISIKMNISPDTIFNWCKNLKYTLTDEENEFIRKEYKRKMNEVMRKYPDELIKIARGYRMDGMLYKDISKLISVGASTIRWWCKDMKKRGYSVEERSNVLKLRGDDLTYSQIVKNTGISKATISRICINNV